MKRHGSDLDPELEAFLTPRKIQRRAPPDVAGAGARPRASDRCGRGVRPRFPRAIPEPPPLPVRARSPSAVGSRSRRRSRSPAPRSERWPALRGRTRALAARSPSPDRCPGAERCRHERRRALRASRPPRTPTRTAAKPPHPARPGAKSDPFTAELELLQRAHAAYTRHDFSVALTLVAEHARRFPNGHLAEQREALRVRSLAGAGRADEAHRAAARSRSGFHAVFCCRGLREARNRRSRDRQTPGRLVWAGAVLLSLLALSGREARAAPLTVRLEYAAGPAVPTPRTSRPSSSPGWVTTPSWKARPSTCWSASSRGTGDHRRTHRVARCERQVGRRADVPVGEHRLSPPGARDGLCARRADSAPGKGGRAPDANVGRLPRPDPRPKRPRPTVAEPPIAAIPSAGGADHRRALRMPRPPPTGGPAAGVRRSAQDRPSGSGCRRRRSCSARLFGALAWQHVSVELARRREPARDDPTRRRRRLLAAASARQRRRVRDRHAMERMPGGERGRGPHGRRDIDRPTSATVPLVQVGVRVGITPAPRAPRLRERTRGRPGQSDALDGQPRPGPGLDRAAIRRGARRRRRRAVSVVCSSVQPRYGAVATACVPS